MRQASRLLATTHFFGTFGFIWSPVLKSDCQDRESVGSEESMSSVAD